MTLTNAKETTVSNFIRTIIDEDLAKGKHKTIVTRFPPEPNGYLHIGHAKSICLNFGLALDYGGHCNLRFDDTNPLKEEEEYVASIKEDVSWLGYDWGRHLHYASDYFQDLYAYALQLIRDEKAYVCSLSQEEIREYRGTLKVPGRESPYRERSVRENLELFEKMRCGAFPEGSHVLRARIDMAHPNLNMRDPVIYRILKASHHRTGDTWCIYPTYDYAHGLSDALEGVTHSLCSLEFEDHRPLYDWFLDQLPVPSRPRQYEFARLNLGYTVLSKRKLIQLVQQGYVQGWDDPRMPTICGLRRRGFSAASIRNFCELIGVGKSYSLVDMSMLEHAAREDLNKTAPRVMGVLDPLKVVLVNYPQEREEELEAVNNPEDPSMGVRLVPFSREIYIEKDDFREDPPRKYFRLAPGREVRLRYGYYITCRDVVKDEQTGEILEVHCTYDPETRGGDSPDKRKVKGTLHWVSARHCLRAEVRLYDRLFLKPDPTADEKEGGDFRRHLNPESLKTIESCPVEPSVKEMRPGTRCQLERKGYFCVDQDTTPEQLILNRTVPLRDSWAKIEQKMKR
ncbi:MAG: glutamine--tRNA ligase/YqeY domain fusion protein [Thermodesulfobacteriota bacterium]